MEQISVKIEENRFKQRTKILYYARISLLFIGLSILVFPQLRNKFNITGITPYLIFLIMLTYSTVNYYIKSFKLLKIFTFLTLIADLIIFTVLIVSSGGLKSPILSTQIVYLIFFTTLFQKPFYLLPPLLVLPIITRVDTILGNNNNVIDAIFTILWFSSLNLIIVYFIVLLNNKTHQNALNLYKFQHEMKEKHLLEEKNKIARDLHDGVGGSLSSLILQSEYIISLLKDKVTKEELKEIQELKFYAEESMEEIRRSLSVIKNSFDLENSILEYIENFTYKNKMEVTYKMESGKVKLSVKDQISVFRVFQEIMTNALKHSGSQKIDLTFKINIDEIYFKIRDFGKGFDPEKNYVGHFGLKNLKERVELLKGTIKINYTKEDGSIFEISIPNKKNQEENNNISLDIFQNS